MSLRLSSVFSVLLGTLLLGTGLGLHQALVPLAATEFAFNDFVISILASAYFGGFLGGCLMAPLLIKRVGHTRTLAIAASSLSALSLILYLWPHEFMWIVGRVLVGYCFANIEVVMESWLADRAEPRTRGQLLAVYRLTSLSALGFGQFLINQASPSEFTLFAVVAIFVSLAVIVVSASVAPAPAPPEEVSIRFFKFAKLAPLSVMAAVLHGVASGIYWGFAPIFASGMETEMFSPGLILAATLFGAGLAQYPIGLASDRFDRRKLLIIMSFLAVLSSGAVAGASFYVQEWTVLTMLLFGGTAFTVYPIAMTYALDRTNPDQFVEIGATVLVSFGLGAFFGPLLTPLVLHFGNYSGAFVLIGFVYLIVFVFAIYRNTQTDDVPEDEVVEFIPVPDTTQVTLEIDPRLDEDAIPGA